MVGQSISHYKILDELGRGGMGIVYRAEDIRLGREVAIKVLPSHALDAGDEAARFGREAQAAAVLNHPNIATVHEIDEADGKSFIVMEYVDGPSLKDRIEEGPLPLDEGIRLAIQVADGLAAAHERGIVHRDIKPANVMLTGKGDAKIMDFGLAQLTDVTQLTKTGTTIGTVVYMSPEQARGEKTDLRSDIFSLGATLYEMIVGRRAFQGAYSEAIVYSILNEDPEPLTALRTGVPMELERIVGKALAKKPAERYQGMKDLLVDLRALEKALPGLSAVTATTSRVRPAAAPTQKTWRTYVPWGVAGLMGLLIGVAVTVLRLRTEETPPIPMLFEVDLPEGGKLMSGMTVNMALARDGRFLVFAVSVRDTARLYLRDMSSLSLKVLPETVGAKSPFFSPDGRWVAYFSSSGLYKIPVDGGGPILLSGLKDGFSGVWLDDGLIVVQRKMRNGFHLFTEDGTFQRVVLPLSKVGDHEIFHNNPETIPGSGAFLVTSAVQSGDGSGTHISLVDALTGELTNVLENAQYAQYVDPGYLVFSRDGAMWAAPFDSEGRRVQSRAFRLIEDIASLLPNRSSPQYAVSRTGMVAFAPGRGVAQSGLVQVSLSGEERVLEDEPGVGPRHGLRMSSVGDRVIASFDFSVWRANIDRPIWTPTDVKGTWPIWYPGGHKIAYAAPSPHSIWMADIDRGGPPVQVANSNNWHWPGDFSPDGRVLALVEAGNPETGSDLMATRIDEPGRLDTLVATAFDERYPAFSPDGKWLAYASDRAGAFEVWVQAYPGPRAPEQVSFGGGVEPLWSPASDEIYFRSEDGDRVYATSFNADLGRPVGDQRLLFTGKYIATAPNGRVWDIMPDGGSFVITSGEEHGVREPIRIQLNILEDALARQ